MINKKWCKYAIPVAITFICMGMHLLVMGPPNASAESNDALYTPTEDPTDTPQVRPTSTPKPGEDPTVTPLIPPTNTPEPPDGTPLPTETPDPDATYTPATEPTEGPSNTPPPSYTPNENPTFTPSETPHMTYTPGEDPTNTPAPTMTPTPEPTASPTPEPETSTPTGVPPSPTPIPTDLPTSTPTMQPPEDTPTPVEPSNTPDPTYTPGDPEPTATPPCSALGCRIEMPGTTFRAGDPCYLKVAICNPGEESLENHPIFAILEASGLFFFAPGFETVEFYELEILPGYTTIDVIPTFAWPEIGTPAENLHWYAAITDPQITTVLGELGMHTFGWE